MKLKTIQFPIFLGNQKERNKKENQKENIRKKKRRTDKLTSLICELIKNPKISRTMNERKRSIERER